MCVSVRARVLFILKVNVRTVLNLYRNPDTHFIYIYVSCHICINHATIGPVRMHSNEE